MASRNPGSEKDPKLNPAAEGGSDGGSDKGSTSLPDYVTAALRIPTSHPLGAKATDSSLLERAFMDPDTPEKVSDTRPVPGVMVFKTIFTYGKADSVTSPINRASYEDFNAIRSQISGNRPYAPSDHMIYRACVDSLRELYYLISRNYCALRNFSATNLYRPKAIFEAMGFDYEDWLDNAPAIYQWLKINEKALEPYPTIPLGDTTQRHITMCSSFFTDGEPDTSQTYVFVPSHLYSYEVVDQAKGITLKKLGDTWSSVRALWDTMLGALSQSSDVYTMAADIRRAFADKVVTSLTAPDVDGIIAYEKMDGMLRSIMNADIISFCHDGSRDRIAELFRIFDDQGVLKCRMSVENVLELEGYPVNAHSTGIISAPAISGHLNFAEPNPSNEEILKAVRFKVTGRVVYLTDTTKWYVKLYDFGTEVILGATMLTLKDDGELDAFEFSTLMCADYTKKESVQATLNAVRDLSCFDWHPRMYVALIQDLDVDKIRVNRIEDVQNYVPISDQNIADIHEAVIYSQLRS